MRIDDFISAAVTEPQRIVLRRVRTPSALAPGVASRPGGLALTDLLSASTEVKEKTFRYGHVLGPGALRLAIETSCRQRGLVGLPLDLLALVERVNGIHLWADLDTGRAYEGLAPFEEWEPARTKMYGPSADRGLLDSRYIALTYHQDGASFVVVDVASGMYYLMDVAAPDDSCVVGRCVEDLLDWLWSHRIAPK